jgi:acetyl esterase/lipase
MGIIIVMIVTLLLFSLYINKKEKRSATSYVSEKILQVSIKKMQSELGKESEAYLEKQRKKNEEPYTLPIKGLAHSRIELVEIDGVEVVIFTPRKKESKATVLYLHGGGYVEHASILHFFFIDSILKLSPCKVMMPLYPKAPAHNATETVLKTKNLYEHMHEEVKDDIFVIGDSAGGGLALAIMQEVKHQPKGIILISPWLDISLSNPLIEEFEDKDPMLSVIHLKNMGIAYRGDLEESDTKVSPILAEISHLGPLTVFVGTHEIFLPDIRKFHDRCVKEGKEILYIEKERMNHDYPLFPMKEGKEAVSIIAEVLTGKI